MSLALFAARLPSATIGFTTNGQPMELKVYPLDWGIIEPLVQDFWDDISEIFEKISEVKDENADVDFMQEIMSLVRKVPLLEARIIAEAAREPDQADAVRYLPLPVRTEALLEIFRLTFVDVESAGKMVGMLQGAFQAIQGLLPAKV